MKIRFNANFTIFVLFFGLSLLESIQTGNWLKAFLWFAIGVAFLLADNLKATRPV